MKHSRPVVVCFSGLDPVGGAGIQADIEAIAAMGAHCAPIITTLTVQDSRGLHENNPVDAALVGRQARLVLEDLSVAAFKLGALGDTHVIAVIAEILRTYPQVPVVVDPVLGASGGGSLADDPMQQAIRSLLLPQATLITPNSPEALRLSGRKTREEAAQVLLEQGCDQVLITGGDDHGETVTNSLHGPDGHFMHWEWPRLPFVFHGSGCTLAAAIAAGLARGRTVEDACSQAQAYTYESLRQGDRPGHGQQFPRRIWKNPENA
jgi:hydroxymethylpyrimidine/phosphomethylpyrimidine kinase